jgi:hypothetical protein
MVVSSEQGLRQECGRKEMLTASRAESKGQHKTFPKS